MLISDKFDWDYIFTLPYYFLNKFYTNVRCIDIIFHQISKDSNILPLETLLKKLMELVRCSCRFELISTLSGPPIPNPVFYVKGINYFVLQFTHWVSEKVTKTTWVTGKSEIKSDKEWTDFCAARPILPFITPQIGCLYTHNQHALPIWWN